MPVAGGPSPGPPGPPQEEPGPRVLDLPEGDSRVALVSMPFCDLDLPSIALTLLKAGLTRRGIQARLFYFGFRLARMVGLPAYQAIDMSATTEMGNYLFSAALFENGTGDLEEYERRVLQLMPSTPPASPRARGGKKLPGILRSIRREIEPFLSQCLDDLVRDAPRIVGFTSLFQQHLASLALARRVKERLPGTFIVFGGPNCLGVKGVELIRQFPFVDAVVSGEGDVVFPELVERVIQGKPLSDLRGVYLQGADLPRSCDGRWPNVEAPRNLDDLPLLDYDDYLDQLKASGLELGTQPKLLCETSRGCWWGKCTFCSLNCDYDGFRCKSEKRALDELLYLFRKYPEYPVQMVDNIVPARYFKEVIPALGDLDFGGVMFYELRSTIRKEQVFLLREAGVWNVQAGVESLSTPILTLMRKGTTALQNIQLLKWCCEIGVDIGWNLIWGFPGEPPQEYERMSRLVPALVHLQPPVSAGGVALSRHSPHFEEAERFGFTDIAPAPPYPLMYPLSPEAVANLAYYFSFGYRNPQDVATYTKPLQAAVASWRRAYPTSILCSLAQDGQLMIWDQRPVAREPLVVLDGLQRALYEACDAIQSVTDLQRLAQAHCGGGCSALEVESLLRPLVAGRLMVQEDDKYLSLSVPVSPYYPDRASVSQFQAYARTRKGIDARERLLARMRLTELAGTCHVRRAQLADARASVAHRAGWR